MWEGADAQRAPGHSQLGAPSLVECADDPLTPHSPGIPNIGNGKDLQRPGLARDIRVLSHPCTGGRTAGTRRRRGQPTNQLTYLTTFGRAADHRYLA